MTADAEESIRRLEAAAEEAEKKLMEAAEKAQKIVDDAAVRAARALGSSPDDSRNLNGSYQWERNGKPGGKSVDVVKEQVKDLEARLKRNTVIIEQCHDSDIEHSVLLKTVIETQNKQNGDVKDLNKAFDVWKADIVTRLEAIRLQLEAQKADSVNSMLLLKRELELQRMEDQRQAGAQREEDLDETATKIAKSQGLLNIRSASIGGIIVLLLAVIITLLTHT